MLEWMWFFVLTALSVAAAAASAARLQLSSHDDEGVPATAGLLLLLIGLCLAFVATYLSWPVIGQPLYELFDNWLPQAGTSIHTTTATVLLVLLGLAYVFGLSLLPLFLDCKSGRQSGNPA